MDGAYPRRPCNPSLPHCGGRGGGTSWTRCVGRSKRGAQSGGSSAKRSWQPASSPSVVSCGLSSRSMSQGKGFRNKQTQIRLSGACNNRTVAVIIIYESRYIVPETSTRHGAMSEHVVAEQGELHGPNPGYDVLGSSPSFPARRAWFPQPLPSPGPSANALSVVWPSLSSPRVRAGRVFCGWCRPGPAWHTALRGPGLQDCQRPAQSRQAQALLAESG